MNMKANITFEDEFKRRLDDLVERAKAAGMTVSALCKKTGTARATPDRWRKQAPLSIKLVDKLEAEVVKAEQAAKQ